MKSPDLDPHLASSYELGWTLNPISGCLNRTPEGLCLGGMFPCYAYRLANGRLRKRYLANPNIARVLRQYDASLPWAKTDPFYPRFWPERLDELRTWTPAYMMPPRGIFVCDMGELFGDWIPSQWQEAIFEAIQTCPQHRFYLLTKQPQNLAKFSPFPPNCWVGVTATDSASFDKAVYHLAEVAADIKYISFEPLLDPVFYDEKPFWGGVEWIIIGSQTKPYRPPEIESVREILSAADHAGIPVFLKDNLKPLLETLNITGGTFGRLTQLTAEAIKDTQGLPRQRGWYELRQEIKKEVNP